MDLCRITAIARVRERIRVRVVRLFALWCKELDLRLRSGRSRWIQRTVLYTASGKEQGGSALEAMIDQAWMRNQLQLELWTEQWILITLKLTGQPVHVSVYAPGA